MEFKVKNKCKKCERNKCKTVRKKLYGSYFFFEDNNMYYALETNWTNRNSRWE